MVGVESRETNRVCGDLEKEIQEGKCVIIVRKEIVNVAILSE